MTTTTTMILFLLVLKHPIADIYLQTYHSNVRKDHWLGNGHRHYLEHAVLTFFIMFCFSNILFALIIAALEYVLHWHIDWGKTSIAKFLKYTREDDKFWRLHTLDQLLHFITYGFLVCVYSKYAF